MRIQTITCNNCLAAYAPLELRDDSWRVPCLHCGTMLFIRGKVTREATVEDKNVRTVFRDLDNAKIRNRQLHYEIAERDELIDTAMEWLCEAGELPSPRDEHLGLLRQKAGLE